ncbi:tautomerase family protein [Microbulbifer taiwanensis]
MTRISLRRGLGADYRARLSALLQRALEEHFAVPPRDCFQLFDEYTAGNRVVDPHYPYGDTAARSGDFLLLQITAGRRRSRAQKCALYSALATACRQQLGLDPADLMVVITCNDVDDWSFSSGRCYGGETQ